MTDEYDPLTGELLPRGMAVNAAPMPSSTPDLSQIDSMDVEALRNLIRKVAGAIWGYAMMDDQQKAEAARLKLYNMGMSASEVHKVVPALDKWFDRTQGKAPQSIAMTVEDKGIGKLTTDRLLRLEAALARITGCDAVIVQPMPKKLDVD